MSNIIAFPSKPHTDEYFGGCPICGQCQDWLNVHRSHWCVCHNHKTKWNVGENLFSSWRYETEADWQRNLYRLANYRTVEPVYPPLTEEEQRWAEENRRLFDQLKAADRGYGSCLTPEGKIIALGPDGFGPDDEDPFDLGGAA